MTYKQYKILVSLWSGHSTDEARKDIEAAIGSAAKALGAKLSRLYLKYGDVFCRATEDFSTATVESFDTDGVVLAGETSPEAKVLLANRFFHVIPMKYLDKAELEELEYGLRKDAIYDTLFHIETCHTEIGFQLKTIDKYMKTLKKQLKG